MQGEAVCRLCAKHGKDMRVDTIVADQESDFNDTLLRMSSLLRRRLVWTITRDSQASTDTFAGFLRRNSRARHELQDVRIEFGFMQGDFGIETE